MNQDPSAKSPGDDRRFALRRHPAQATYCHLASGSGEKIGLGLVWNISTHGVSMLFNRPVEPGTALKAELVNASQTASVPRELRVAHVRKLLTGDYLLGGQFARSLAEEEMKPFLAQ